MTVFGVDVERKTSATVFVLCQVHRWRAKPLAEVHIGFRKLEVKRGGEPVDPFLMHGNFSARCGMANEHGRCHIRVTLKYKSLVQLADNLRERRGRAIEFDSSEINLLINHPDKVQRYTLERAKIDSAAVGELSTRESGCR